MIWYCIAGVLILFADVFIVAPYAMNRLSSNYVSIREKAGLLIFTLVLTTAPFYSFYLGYQTTLLYELWPVNFFSFVTGAIVITVFGALYVFLESFTTS